MWAAHPSQPTRLIWTSKAYTLYMYVNEFIIELLFVVTGIPLVTLTATATAQIRSTVLKDLDMHDCAFVIEDADRPNIKYSVSHIASLDHSFTWLIEELKDKGVKTPRVLVFCQSKPQCTSLFELFRKELGQDKMYNVKEGQPKDDRTSLIGMYHHGTREQQKETAARAFTASESNMRVLFCTSSFGMGVDVKNCNLVLHVGPPKLLDEYLQQSGRVGRDKSPSHAILLLFKQCTAGGGFEDELKAYISNSEVCRRTVLLNAIQNPTVKSLAILHSCCDICAQTCTCLCNCSVATECQCDKRCVGPNVYLSKAENEIINQKTDIKSISDLPKVWPHIGDHDRLKFEQSLGEIRLSLLDQECAKDMIVHADIVTGFSSQLIHSLVDNLEYISSVETLMNFFPFFNVSHAVLVYDLIAARFPSHHTVNSEDEDNECLCDICSSDSDNTEAEFVMEEQWDDYTKPTVGISDSDYSD